jgi:hypothetical protein
MEMQITADFSQLTAEQRDHLAGFILTFPPEPNYEPEPAPLSKDNMESITITPVTDDPAAAFGAQAPVAQAGPTLIIPPPPREPTVGELMRSGNLQPIIDALSRAPVKPAASPEEVPERATVEIDKYGLPWDGRIHASTKAKNADGSWRKKRGLDAATLAQVEAELKALMAIPAVPVPPPPPPAPGPTLVPAPPPSTSGDPRAAFVALVGRASAAMQAKKITEDEIKGCCKSVDSNIVSLPLLAARPDLIPQVAALIDGIIAGRNA